MRWGLIGYGEIAEPFVEALATVAGQELCAIASVSKADCLRTDARHLKVRIYSRYWELVADDQIDVVYVCTSNQLHKENVLAALRSGKHVLCEKPLGVCRAEVEEMVSVARERRRFLMEGMWTRFLPAYRHFKELLMAGAVGRVNFLRADFGFVSDWGPTRRLKNREIFGGTLLDNADYGLFLGQDVFGDRPRQVAAFARQCETGVEDMCGIMLQYPDGSIAQLFSSFQQKTNQEALIYGDRGLLHLRPFWNGTKVALSTDRGTEQWEFPFATNGFEYEISEVANAVRENKVESDTIPHRLSVEIATLMDDIIRKTAVAIE